MTSPYLLHVQRRMGIAPITETRKTDFNPAHYRMARTSREAGQEFASWEDRLPPLRSWAKDFTIALAWLCAVAFLAWFVLPVLMEILK